MGRWSAIAAIARKMDGQPESLQPLPPYEAIVLLDEIRALRGALESVLTWHGRPRREESEAIQNATRLLNRNR